MSACGCAATLAQREAADRAEARSTYTRAGNSGRLRAQVVHAAGLGAFTEPVLGAAKYPTSHPIRTGGVELERDLATCGHFARIGRFFGPPAAPVARPARPSR